MKEPRIIWSGQAELGEGPVWDQRYNCLWFVDIKKKQLYRLDPETGDCTSWQAPAQIGWVLPASGSGLLAGLQGGLYHFTPENGEFLCIQEIEKDQPGNRLNDATVGPDGRVWFGSMDDATSVRTGRVYQWRDQQVTLTPIPAAVVTNGPAVSPDGSTLYFVDTIEGEVRAWEIDGNGLKGPGQLFVRLKAKEGCPDGVTVDSAGNVWMGVWGGSCARCYAPDGTLLRQVNLPASNVTKVALGGPELKTAFATTARLELDEATLSREPNSGAVFAFDVEVPGQTYPLVNI